MTSKRMGGMMFGNNDDAQDKVGGNYSDNTATTQASSPNIDDLLPATTPDDSTPPAPSLNVPEPSEPSSPAQDQAQNQTLDEPQDQPTQDMPEPSQSTDDNDSGSDELLNIKQQALQQLSPLVNELEQTPEERFRTTMMMIQASDNQDLIKSAYDAAEQISDKKEKAQALLDVVNEINYFTSQAPSETN